MAKSKIPGVFVALRPGQKAPRSGSYARLTPDGRRAGTFIIPKGHLLPHASPEHTYRFLHSMKLAMIWVSSSPGSPRSLEARNNKSTMIRQGAGPTYAVTGPTQTVFATSGPRANPVATSRPIAESKEDFARQLALDHATTDAGLRRVLRLSSDREDLAGEPVKLLEINENTIAAGIVPVRFGPDPSRGIPYSATIVEVTPEEYGQIERGELTLPESWRVSVEYAIPDDERTR